LIAGRYLLSPRIGAKAGHGLLPANRAKFTETVTAPTGNYGVTEDIYRRLRPGQLQIGDLTVLGGLRYEKTKVESDAIRNTGGVLTPVAIRGSYGNWLPSASPAVEADQELDRPRRLDQHHRPAGLRLAGRQRRPELRRQPADPVARQPRT
jgi:hypothetical protein